MSKKARLINILIGFILLITSAATRAAPLEQAQTWQSKVDPWVLDTAARGETEFLVFLPQQANLSAAANLETKLEKGTYVFEQLTATAEKTQAPLLDALRQMGLEHRSYWVANMIWVRGDLASIQTLASRSDVAHLYANPKVKADLPVPSASEVLPFLPNAIEWNINKVNAPQVWDLGFNGQGAVVAGQDTGYDWDHPALINQYAGWNGSTADHNYHWHDAIHSGGGVCGPNSMVPCDDHYHGTHTMGTIVGNDGATNQIGMAPGARWIGCRNMDQGAGTPTTYSECYQWFIAPTDLTGQNPDPSKAPDVINNSWGCPTSEGCTDPNVLLTVVQNVRAAGILTAHSAGNSGSSCSTVSDPAAIYDESFTVGNTTSTDFISSSSSRGPVTVDGSGRLKPDISAPGTSVRSSIPGTGYGTLSGTSMAAPHVAGLTALLISARPSLAGQVSLLEQLMMYSALDRTTTSQACGGIPGISVPNNTYGWGRIDALAAYNLLTTPLTVELDNIVSTSEIPPGGLLTYTILVINPDSSRSMSNLILRDPLPANTTLVSASQPYVLVGNTVVWLKSSLAAREAWQVQLVVQVDADATGTITNQNYSVSSDQSFPLTGSPVVAQVTTNELHINKQASSISIQPGGTLTYTLSVTNPHETSTQHTLILTDTIPAGTTFLTATVPYTLQGDTVTWLREILGPAETWQVEMIVAVPLSASGVITNIAATASLEAPGVESAPVVTEVVPFATEVTKSVSTVDIDPGGVLTYTLTILNDHPFAAQHSLVLTDTLPSNTEFITGTLPASFQDGIVQWQLNRLGAGELWQVDFSVAVPLTSTGIIVNQHYGVQSQEARRVFGPPVYTSIGSLGLTLSPDQQAQGESGAVVSYTHALTNTGNYTRTYALSHTSSKVWQISYPQEVTVAPGESLPIIIDVSIPQWVNTGTQEITTITVWPKYFPEFAISVDDITTVGGSQYVLFHPRFFKAGEPPER